MVYGTGALSVSRNNNHKSRLGDREHSNRKGNGNDQFAVASRLNIYE